MKKSISLLMAACVIYVMTFQTSCIGSFQLTKNVHSWNMEMDKFVGELVFLVFVILPVYGISLFIDAIILNLIEFWSGSNPMSMKAGEIEKQVAVGKDGETYEVTATMNRYDIVQLSGEKTGEKTSLVYNPEEKSWSQEKDEKVTKLVQLTEDGKYAKVYTPNGDIAILPSSIRDKNLAAKMIQEQTEYVAIVE